MIRQYTTGRSEVAVYHHRAVKRCYRFRSYIVSLIAETFLLPRWTVGYDHHSKSLSLPTLQYSLDQLPRRICHDAKLMEKIYEDVHMQICELHLKGFCHGDIKPMNIMVKTNYAYLALARELPFVEDLGEIEVEGHLIDMEVKPWYVVHDECTPHWSCPEYVLSPDKADMRANDFFCLAASFASSIIGEFLPLIPRRGESFKAIRTAACRERYEESVINGRWSDLVKRRIESAGRLSPFFSREFDRVLRVNPEERDHPVLWTNHSLLTYNELIIGDVPFLSDTLLFVFETGTASSWLNMEAVASAMLMTVAGLSALPWMRHKDVAVVCLSMADCFFSRKSKELCQWRAQSSHTTRVEMLWEVREKLLRSNVHKSILSHRRWIRYPELAVHDARVIALEGTTKLTDVKEKLSMLSIRNEWKEYYYQCFHVIFSLINLSIPDVANTEIDVDLQHSLVLDLRG